MDLLKTKEIYFTILLFVQFTWTYSQTSNVDGETEKLRQSAKQECIQVTASALDFANDKEKEDLKRRAKNYCECLYDRITKRDLIRVLKMETLMAELLNIRYKKQQDECYQKNFKGIETHAASNSFTTDNEKIAFWSGRLITYYLMTYSQYSYDRMIKISKCFDPFLKSNYSGQFDNWSNRELTATEILKENQKIKEKLLGCNK